jgi:hypothetical protein
MSTINTWLDCPNDCDTAVLLPAISQEQDCTSYPQKDSQVCDLVIQPDGADAPFDFTVPLVPTVVALAIDNTEALNAKSKRIVGTGGVDAPDEQEQAYPKQQTRVVKRIYTLVFNIHNLDAAHYAFGQALQCGDTGFTFWYANLAGNLFGGVTGIRPKSVKAVMPLGAGNEDKEIITVTIMWEADGDPDRTPSPLA